MVMTVEKCKDLIATTLNHLGELKWTDIALDLQEYIAMSRILNKKRVKFDGGKAIQWNVRVDYVDAAENTGLFAQDTVNVGDSMKIAQIPWRHSTTNYAFEVREMSMNKGARRLVNLVEERRNGSLTSLAELMERNFWGKPDSSADEETPFGIKYWIVTNATEGFNGGNPTGFDDGPGGLDCDVYANWKNYTAQYAAVSQTDLIRKWRTATRKTNFRSPVKNPDYNTGNKYEYFTNHDVLQLLEEYLEDRNDTLSSSNIKVADSGDLLFRRNPVYWVPYLDSDTTDPIYGINWGVFNPVFLGGEYMRTTGPDKAPLQHNTLVVFTDLTYNFRCTDRRKLFVLSK